MMDTSEMSTTEYDVIVIGGGPNGELLATYLQKAGAQVLLIERRHELGGGLLTEDFDGFRFNLHAEYMMLGDIMPPHQDLFLPQYGVEFIKPSVQLSLFYDNNKALVFYLDPQKTADSIAKISQEDATRFLKLYADFKEVCIKSLIPSSYVAMIPPGELAAMLGESEVGRKVLEWSEKSPLDMLEDYGIRDDRVKAGLLYLGCKWGIEPDLPGIGYMFPIYTYGMLNASLVRGGSHRLNSAIIRAGYEAGMQVRELTEVKKVIVDAGEARGVVTESGEKIHAKAVVSSLNPPMTFLQLVGEEHLDQDFAATVKQWQWDEWSLFCIHMGTKKLPVYKASETEPHCGEAMSQVVGYESAEEVLKHWKDCMEGKLPGPGATFTPTSLFDPSQAPKGYCNIRVETEAPFEVKGQDWEVIKDEYAASIIRHWETYLANPSEVGIIKNYPYPPSYIEQKLPNMVRGSIKQGAYIPTQMGYFRPNVECSNYSTPIKNLYVTGAATYPGGMITLGPGYCASMKVATDLGLNVWWKYPPWLEEARKNRLAP